MTDEIKTKERFLVQEVDKRLADYFRRLDIPYLSCLPDNTEQNFFDLNQHCADLIGCAGTWKALLLEFKIHHEGILPSFKQIQHDGLLVLNKFGIPVEYCFNRAALPPTSTDDVFLSHLLVCDAAPLPGRKPALTHGTLLQRLQNLVTGTPPSLTPLAICDSSLFGTQRVAQLNTARLLILADGTVTHLGITEGRALVDSLLANKHWAGDKNVTRLRHDLEKLLNSRDQLFEELSAAGWAPAPPSSEHLSEVLGESEDEEKSLGNNLRPF